jgi:hypothetical protein
MWKPVVSVLVAAVVSSSSSVRAAALPFPVQADAPTQTASASETAEQPYSPPALFASDEVVEFTLTADFDKIKGDRKEESEYRPGVMTVTADDGSPREIEVKLKTRGKFRLKTCRFPPLRLNLPKGSLDGTVFDGQNKIKLVTHCRDGEGDEQNLLEEYLVYRTYNVITDRSFRVRLARITYVDTSGDDDPLTRFAFFIEEVDAIADRLGGLILNVKQVHPKHLSARESARMAVFEYMVGNTDWSMIYFHNVELLRTAESVHVPVPYDFDWAGFVAPSYAKPDKSLNIRSVRDRIYRGFCRPDVDYTDIYAEFVSLRPEFEALYTDLEGFQEDKVEDALSYVKGFYETIGSERRARRSIEESCRRT